jgi:hypothetical protein
MSSKEATARERDRAALAILRQVFERLNEKDLSDFGMEI